MTHMTDLATLPADQLAEAYRARRLSPVEVTGAVLEALDRVEPGDQRLRPR